jgi:hypothetical protein
MEEIKKCTQYFSLKPFGVCKQLLDTPKHRGGIGKCKGKKVKISLLQALEAHRVARG